MPALGIDDVHTGIREAKRGNIKLGMELLHDFATTDGFPEAKAWYGYCLSHSKQSSQAGIDLCREAIKNYPDRADGYLALGRIYLSRKNRRRAVEVLQAGLKIDPGGEINQLLNSIGVRKKPVIPGLSRDNLLNIYLGRLLSVMGAR